MWQVAQGDNSSRARYLSAVSPLLTWLWERPEMATASFSRRVSSCLLSCVCWLASVKRENICRHSGVRFSRSSGREDENRKLLRVDLTLWRFLSFPKHVTFGPRRYKPFWTGRNVTIRLGLKHVFLFPSLIFHWSRKREAGRPFGLRPTLNTRNCSPNWETRNQKPYWSQKLVDCEDFVCTKVE